MGDGPIHNPHSPSFSLPVPPALLPILEPGAPEAGIFAGNGQVPPLQPLSSASAFVEETAGKKAATKATKQKRNEAFANERFERTATTLDPIVRLCYNQIFLSPLDVLNDTRIN
jgi:hypothetical protein